MGITVTVEDKDTGFNAFGEIMMALAKDAPELRVGIFGDALDADGRLTLAELLAIQEFGTRNGHVPARPALQITAFREEDKWVGLFGEMLRKSFNGKVNFAEEMARIGEVMAADVKRTIAYMVPPENKPDTVRKKGFDHPLIETQTMQNAMTYKLTRRDGGKPQGWLARVWSFFK